MPMPHTRWTQTHRPKAAMMSRQMRWHDTWNRILVDPGRILLRGKTYHKFEYGVNTLTKFKLGGIMWHKLKKGVKCVTKIKIWGKKWK
jgi:hypothetical protein